MATEAIADVKVQRENTLFLVFPLTPEANDWIADNIPDDALFYGSALVVEQRYIVDIVNGMVSEGLKVI